MNTEEKILAIREVLRRRSSAVEIDSVTCRRERRRLLTEIGQLKKRARRGGVPREDWENHELNWIGYCAILRNHLVRSLAQSLIRSERKSERNDVGLEKHAPELTPKMRHILNWWAAEGGKEKLLSELPIEERSALEARRGR
jgi:hypothetical protein